jgi:hypothetical protein
VNEERVLIISRKYQKGSDTHDLFVAQVSGADVSGEVFQYELWLNNAENREMRVTSGNAYTVRRAFIGTLLDLHEDGWSKRGSASYGSSHVAFFDPAGL